MNTPDRSFAINRCYWIVAVVLVALASGTSFGKETKVETNDEKLLALCKDPEATPEAIKALLKAGADIKARDKNGKTPLMEAAMLNMNPEVIEVLLKAGADIEARDKNGKTPLMGAAEKNMFPKVIEALLRAGANAKAKDKEGKTALDHAKDNKKIYKTKVYWKLNDLQYE